MGFRTAGFNWENRKWQTATPITTLVDQIEVIRPTMYPQDGTVASKRHDQSSPNSDHRPDENGTVRAADWGADGDSLDRWYENLRLSEDPRIKYCIHGGHIFSSYPAHGYEPYDLRPYSGSSPHPDHIHLSTLEAYDNDDSPWALEEEVPQFTPEEEAAIRRIITADAEDLTQEGEVFAGRWVQALADRIVTEGSSPIDLLSKQEYAATLERSALDRIRALERMVEALAEGHPHQDTPAGPLEPFTALITPTTEG